VRRGGEKIRLPRADLSFSVLPHFSLIQQGSTSHSERNTFEYNEPDENRRREQALRISFDFFFPLPSRRIFERMTLFPI